jgi:hypothetical protein
MTLTSICSLFLLAPRGRGRRQDVNGVDFLGDLL